VGSRAYLEGKNFIPRDQILEHVSLSVSRNAIARIPGIVDFAEANVIKRPLKIYDINGKPLFFDYAIKRGAKTLGTVRAAASKILGSPVIAYEMGPRYWNFKVAVKKLIPRVKKKYPRGRIRRTRLVCYSYPKLGVMFEITDERGEPSRLIFDVADLSLIPEKPPKPGVEGAYAWSFYDALPEDARKLRLERYNLFDKWRLEIPASKRETLRRARTLTRVQAMAVKEAWWPIDWKITVTRRLQFCPHYREYEPRSHHCFVLHGQEENDYCAVATCQMILCYYRYYYSQDDIAPALGYNGGCPPDQSAGYEQLSCNHLDATYDTSPEWNEARDQIRALHPLKSGVTGHARACAGYSYVWHLFGGGIEDRKLLIYDPSPWNENLKLAGSVYWEEWDSIYHTNFIYTRLLCP